MIKMIEVRIYWSRSAPEKRGERYTIALYQFGDDKTKAILEKLNELSQNPMKIQKVLDSWPLGSQHPSREG